MRAAVIMDSLGLPVWDDVVTAHERIAPHVHRTPVLTSRFVDGLAGAQLFFKCENFQKAGAFKVRGACNAVFWLAEAVAPKGVATHSSGNHALSLAYAAARRGIPCHVVMPRTAPQVKKDAVRAYGGMITECEPSTSSREQHLARVQAATGADFVHPYNDARVIAGQATCAKEMIEDLGPLDVVVAPIGGGGMVSGTCLTCSTLAPATSIYAAEPEAADDACQSFRQGRIVAAGLGVSAAAEFSPEAHRRLQQVIRAAVEEDGADAVILGSGGVAGHGARLSASSPVRITDSMEAGIPVAAAAA
jgi:threonine dehydratase